MAEIQRIQGMLPPVTFEDELLNKGMFPPSLLTLSEYARKPVDAAYGMIPNVPEEVQQALMDIPYVRPGLKALGEEAQTLFSTPIGNSLLEAGSYIAGTDTGKTIGNLLTALEIVPAIKGATNIKNIAQMATQNLPNDLSKGKNKFYLSTTAAKETALKNNPNLKGAALESAINSIKGQSRFKSMTGGLVTGINNFLKQAMTPQGQADWRQSGVSKTMTDMVRDPDFNQPDAATFGQLGWENLTSTQFDNLSPVLKQLDDEYYTHKSVLSADEFTNFAGLEGDDAGAFYRTIMNQQGIDPTKQSDFIMVGRQPVQTAKSGQLSYTALNKGKVPETMLSVFPMKKPFADGGAFIRALKKGDDPKKGTVNQLLNNPKTAKARTKAIKLAFENNPELATLTDPVDFSEALQAAVDKVPARIRGPKFSVKDAVGRSMYKTNQQGFKSNSELLAHVKKRFAEQIKSKQVTVVQNKAQTNLPEAERDIFLIASETSDAFELGGVNVVYKINKNGNLTAMVSDVNDIGVGKKNINTPGAKKLVVVTPPMTRSMLTGDKDALPKPKVEKTVQSVVDEITPLAKKTPADYGNAAMAASPLYYTARGITEEEELDDPFGFDPDLFGF
tara:strand:+ start:2296 stop:4146 length:1851 start_codon:yes stop_codon:yes gene_type:complete